MAKIFSKSGVECESETYSIYNKPERVYGSGQAKLGYGEDGIVSYWDVNVYTSGVNRTPPDTEDASALRSQYDAMAASDCRG